MAGLITRIKEFRHAWNLFKNGEEKFRDEVRYAEGVAFGHRPDRPRVHYNNERGIVAAIYTRMAVDAAMLSIRHVRLDDDGRYLEDVDSGLNNCLTVEANRDQTALHFRQDIMWTLINKGVVAIVPTDLTMDPTKTNTLDIQTMRVGEVVDWAPEHVTVRLFNEKKGTREDIPVPKRLAAVVENPFYSVMNERNSTLQRLVRKLNILDDIDEQSASGKLDIIIQLPYVVRSEARKQQAAQRKQELEAQLKDSKYGIAYTDATEKITQLNRGAENNLLKQVEYLTAMAYSQLGITQDIMNGTADESAMLNYLSRTIGPVVEAVVQSMRRTFLTKTARTQRQSIMYFTDPFKLVPLSTIAEIADKFTRNEILSANEIRQAIGIKPSKDPKADELRNANMPAPSEPATSQPSQQEGDSQNGT